MSGEGGWRGRGGWGSAGTCVFLVQREGGGLPVRTGSHCFEGVRKEGKREGTCWQICGAGEGLELNTAMGSTRGGRERGKRGGESMGGKRALGSAKERGRPKERSIRFCFLCEERIAVGPASAVTAACAPAGYAVKKWPRWPKSALRLEGSSEQNLILFRTNHLVTGSKGERVPGGGGNEDEWF